MSQRQVKNPRQPRNAQNNASLPKPKQQPRRRRQPRQLPMTAQPSAPISLGQRGKIPSPKFRNSKPGTTRVSHTELIGDVVGSDLFTATKYEINAGLQSMFSWLANIASNYETYKFHRLRFRYANANATTQVGYIYLTVEFDPADPVPTSEQQIANYQDTVHGSTWVNHTYECSKTSMARMNSYLVRNGAGPSPNELPQFDVGYLLLATTQNDGTPNLGKLWVDYDVEFATPQNNSPAVGNSLSGKFTTTTNFTANPVKVGNMPLTATAAAGTLTITSSQAYSALMNFTITGTTIGATPVTPIGGTGAVTLSNQFVNAAATNAILAGLANFPAQGSTLTFAISAATVSNVAIKFGQYNIAVNQ